MFSLARLERGYSRAFALRLLPAFTQKAVGAEANKRKDWEACLLVLQWVCQQLDAAGRTGQQLLALVDGGLERPVGFWWQLPERTVLLACNARHPSRMAYGQRGLEDPPGAGPWAGLRDALPV